MRDLMRRSVAWFCFLILAMADFGSRSVLWLASPPCGRKYSLTPHLRSYSPVLVTFRHAGNLARPTRSRLTWSSSNSWEDPEFALLPEVSSKMSYGLLPVHSLLAKCDSWITYALYFTSGGVYICIWTECHRTYKHLTLLSSCSIKFSCGIILGWFSTDMVII
jgi:hypothetical protein